MSYHVTPIDDILPHAQESTCECCPCLREVDGSMVFIHNSFDGRESLEDALAEADSKKCLDLYVSYMMDLQMKVILGSMTSENFKKRVESAYVRMYDHWKRMDVEIKFE